MTSIVFTKLRTMLLIALTAPILASAADTAYLVVDKRLDQLIDGCVKFVVADPTKSKDGADACEKVANSLKARAELHQKVVEYELSAKERSTLASFGWPGLILFDVLLVLLLIAVFVTTKGKSINLLNDPNGKVSFSRVVGLFGAASIFIASALLLNVLLAHLYVFNKVPDGIVSLFAPILTFVPTLFPYVFAKREEGVTARAKITRQTPR